LSGEFSIGFFLSSFLSRAERKELFLALASLDDKTKEGANGVLDVLSLLSLS